MLFSVEPICLYLAVMEMYITNAVFGKETYCHCTTPAYSVKLLRPECRDPGSDWGHRDFQSRALPTELSRLMYIFVKRA